MFSTVQQSRQPFSQRVWGVTERARDLPSACTVVSGLTGLRSHHPGSLRAGEQCAAGLDRPVSSPPLSELEPSSCAVAASAQSGGLSAVVFQAAPSPASKRLNSHPAGGSAPGLDSQSCPCARGSVVPTRNHSPRLPGIRDKDRVHQYLSGGCSGTPTLASLCCCREGAPAFHPLLGESCVGRGLFSQPAPRSPGLTGGQVPAVWVWFLASVL